MNEDDKILAVVSAIGFLLWLGLCAALYGWGPL